MRYFYLDGKIPVECSKEDLIKYKSNNINTFTGYSTLKEFKDNKSHLHLYFQHILTNSFIPLLFRLNITLMNECVNTSLEVSYTTYDIAIKEYNNIIMLLNNNLELNKPDVERTYKRICLRQ